MISHNTKTTFLLPLFATKTVLCSQSMDTTRPLKMLQSELLGFLRGFLDHIKINLDKFQWCLQKKELDNVTEGSVSVFLPRYRR